MSAKYKDLRDEILNNQAYNLPIYNYNMFLRKATAYSHSDRVKSMKNIDGLPISIGHLLGIVIYCGCTDLCT